MDVEVPQYAYHVSKEKGSKVPGVLIQAVEIKGMSVVAFTSLPDRKHHVATLDEFELLGNRPPD